MSKAENTEIGLTDITENKEDIKVSVICITYNHEKFLRECLDSIVCQRTNFPFEIIVHDDKSTDKTIEIIKEYKTRYPHLIVPILEKENQYSKTKSIVEDFALPYAKGKYIAICEGDDKWCDESKLQKQYDFMESHPDYVACFHNTIMHDLSGKNPDQLFNKFKEITELTAEYIFKDRYVHTTSYFIKKEYYKKLEFGRNCWFGDFAILTALFSKGRLSALPEVMSVYNFNNKEGVMKSQVGSSIEKQINSAQVEIDYLNKYNNYTKLNYNDYISNRISNIVIYNVYDNKLLLSKNNKEYNKIRKELLGSAEYKEAFKNRGVKGRIKLFVKYHLPRKIFIKYRGK